MDEIIALDANDILDENINANLNNTIATFLENFLSTNTRAAYTTDFFDFAAYLEINKIYLDGPHQITKKHIIRYRDTILKDYAPNTISRKLSSLSSLFNELVAVDLMPKNPVNSVKRPRAISVRTKTGFSDSEINKICHYYDGATIQSLQSKALLTFLSYTGCRISEVVAARVLDITTEDDIKLIKIMGKGAKIRKIPLHPKLWSVLKELIQRREKQDDDYIFTAVKKKLASPINRKSVHEMLKKTLIALGMAQHKTLHSFRRGVISNLLQNGHRIESVAQVSGHSNINTTKGYLVREDKMEDNPLLSLNFKQ